MDVERATGAQRVGIFLAFVEGCLFAFLSAAHFGFVWRFGEFSYALPFQYPAAIVDGVLALALVIAVLLPGGGNVRAGRVLAAQMLSVIGVFIIEVALLRGLGLTSLQHEIPHGVALVLALASIALVASPAYHLHAKRLP